MKQIILSLLLFLTIAATGRASSIKISRPYGIDISHHSGNINWALVPKDISFVYIKATEGATFTDPLYLKNITEARKQGFKVGSYHYFRMTSSPEQQFEHISKVVAKDQQDLRLMIDVETDDGYSRSEVQANLNKLITLLVSHYEHEPIIYGTNKSYNKLLAPQFNNYLLYIGRYSDSKPLILSLFPNKCCIWQYSERGKVPGIPKYCDLARFNSGKMQDIILPSKL